MAKKNRTNQQKLGLFQKSALYFFDHIRITAILWVVVVVAGVAVYGWLMKREGFPSVQVPVGVVQVGYPLKEAAAVDAEVIRPIEENIRKSSKVDSVTATSNNNFGTLVIQFSDSAGTSKDGIAEIRSIVEKIQLPAEASIVYQDIDAAKFNNKYEALLAVTSESVTDTKQLYDAAQRVADAANNGANALGGGYTAEVLTQFVEGKSLNGNTIAIQRSGDRIGGSLGDSIVFKNAVTVGIIPPENFDIFELQQKLEKFVQADGFEDVKVEISATFANDISRQIENLQGSLLEGLAIILVISLVLIHFRAGIVTGLSMLTVLFLTLLVLFIAGFTLNTITLFALILCLGLIVDDTTIVAEAIDKESTKNKDKRTVISEAVRKVALASGAGTITTMLGFAPLLFIGGVLGDFIRIMPITIIVSLAMSLLVSLSLVPFLSRWSIRSKDTTSFASRILQKIVAHPLASILRFLRHSTLSKTAFSLLAISLSVVTLFIAGFYFQKLEFDIFPNTKDSNSLSIAVRFQGITNTNDAIAALQPIESVLDSIAGKSIQSAAYYNQISSNGATMIVRLVPYEDREITAPQLVKNLDEAFDELQNVSISVRQNDAGPPKDDLPFRVQIKTEDVNKANEAVAELLPILKDAQIVRNNGTTATIINAQQTDGVSIIRTDGARITEVRAGFDADDTSALVGLAQDYVNSELTDEKLAALGLSRADFTFDFGSEEENQESFKTMIVAFPILLLVMFILLAIQFKSVIQPLLIFLAVPFSLLGVAVGLYVTNNPLSFFVMIGLFALIGISVNNTILLTDYANQGLREGKSHTDAIADALEQRFRPLLVTSLTAVTALIPLALSDPFWEPLCVTLIFGLISSTLLVITVFPYYYLMVEKLRLLARRGWKKLRRA